MSKAVHSGLLSRNKLHGCQNSQRCRFVSRLIGGMIRPLQGERLCIPMGDEKRGIKFSHVLSRHLAVKSGVEKQMKRQSAAKILSPRLVRTDQWRTRSSSQGRWTSRRTGKVCHVPSAAYFSPLLAERSRTASIAGSVLSLGIYLRLRKHHVFWFAQTPRNLVFAQTPRLLVLASRSGQASLLRHLPSLLICERNALFQCTETPTEWYNRGMLLCDCTLCHVSCVGS
jgi:hypothetical protein